MQRFKFVNWRIGELENLFFDVMNRVYIIFWSRLIQTEEWYEKRRNFVHWKAKKSHGIYLSRKNHVCDTTLISKFYRNKSPKFWNPCWPIFCAAILQPVSKAVFNDLSLIKDAITQATKVSPAPQLSIILPTSSAWTKSTCPFWSMAPAPLWPQTGIIYCW